MASHSNPASPELPSIRDESGQVILRTALIATLYFENGLDLEVRWRIGECLDLYLAATGNELHWMTDPDAERWYRIDTSRLEAFKNWLRTGTPDYSWEASFLGGRNPHEASEFQFLVFAKKGWLSYIQVVLPMNWLETPHGSFPNFVLRLCQILKPYHGYGGLGFAESSDIGIADKVQPLIYSLARRFPGLEVDRPLLHIRYVSKGIKGVNWLTILGPRWVDAMGGVTRLRESLSELFVFYEYDGSLLIQAGPRPQPGDVNQRLWPTLYAELARLLKPIRISEHFSFDKYGENRFTQETSQEWLARFDSDPF